MRGKREDDMSIDYSKDFFLGDQNIDRVMKVVIALAREAYVTKDRLALIEKKLDEQGIVSSDWIDQFAPSDEESREIEHRRDEFVASILRPLVKDWVEPERGRNDEN